VFVYGKQVSNGDTRVRGDQGRRVAVGGDDRHVLIVGAPPSRRVGAGIAMDLELAVVQVENPVVGDSSLGVDVPFDDPVLA
jgi:hypothetical protein